MLYRLRVFWKLESHIQLTSGIEMCGVSQRQEESGTPKEEHDKIKLKSKPKLQAVGF